MKSSENLLIFAYKTKNFYEITPEQYNTILTSSVTKTHQKARRRTQLTIDRETKIIFESLEMQKKK